MAHINHLTNISYNYYKYERMAQMQLNHLPDITVGRIITLKVRNKMKQIVGSEMAFLI